MICSCHLNNGCVPTGSQAEVWLPFLHLLIFLWEEIYHVLHLAAHSHDRFEHGLPRLRKVPAYKARPAGVADGVLFLCCDQLGHPVLCRQPRQRRPSARVQRHELGAVPPGACPRRNGGGQHLCLPRRLVSEHASGHVGCGHCGAPCVCGLSRLPRGHITPSKLIGLACCIVGLYFLNK